MLKVCDATKSVISLSYICMTNERLICSERHWYRFCKFWRSLFVVDLRTLVPNLRTCTQRMFGRKNTELERKHRPTCHLQRGWCTCRCSWSDVIYVDWKKSKLAKRWTQSTEGDKRLRNTTQNGKKRQKWKWNIHPNIYFMVTPDFVFCLLYTSHFMTRVRGTTASIIIKDEYFDVGHCIGSCHTSSAVCELAQDGNRTNFRKCKKLVRWR